MTIPHLLNIKFEDNPITEDVAETIAMGSVILYKSKLRIMELSQDGLWGNIKTDYERAFVFETHGILFYADVTFVDPYGQAKMTKIKFIVASEILEADYADGYLISHCDPYNQEVEGDMVPVRSVERDGNDIVFH